MAENMYHDEIKCHSTSGWCRNKVDKFRIYLKKNSTILPHERNKADKFRINLKKAWWNDQKYDEIPKVAICTRFGIKTLKNSDRFHHAPDQCCHFPVKLVWQACPDNLFGNPFFCFSTSISSQPSPPSISKERSNFLPNPVIYATNWQTPTSSSRGIWSGNIWKHMSIQSITLHAHVHTMNNTILIFQEMNLRVKNTCM